MTSSNNLGIPFVVQSQAQKEVTINDAISILEAMQNRGVADKDLATPPPSPANGDAYIIAASPTGAWSGKAKYIAYYNASWKFISPNEGLMVWVNDEDKIYVYNGASWNAYGDLNSLAMLGVNAMPDATNRLSVNTDAVLFNNNGSDIRAKLNKNAAANTASFLFQDAFSGRAEFGLIGDDDFRLKTSADGSAWNNSFRALKTDGSVDFLSGIRFGGGSSKLSIYEEGSFTPTFLGATTAGTPTYAVQTGVYTRIGRMVHIHVRLQLSALGGMTGALKVGGLPYSCNSSIICPISVGEQVNMAAAIYDHYAVVQSGTSQIYLYKAASGGTAALSSTADITASTRMWFGGSYSI